MSVTVLAMVTINENQPMALAKYLEATTPLLAQAGAAIVSRFQVEEAVVGEKPSQTMIMVNYPSRRAVDMVFESDTYKEIIPWRDKAFIDYHVTIVTNNDDEAPKAAGNLK